MLERRIPHLSWKINFQCLQLYIAGIKPAIDVGFSSIGLVEINNQCLSSLAAVLQEHYYVALEVVALVNCYRNSQPLSLQYHYQAILIQDHQVVNNYAASISLKRIPFPPSNSKVNG